MEFRRKRRLSLRTALSEHRCFLTAPATLYRSPKTGNLFVVSIGHLASSVPHTVRLCVKSERSVTSGLANDAKGKGTSSEPARPKVPMRRTGADSSVIARKRSNARGAKGAGHRRWERANWQQEEPPFLDGRRRSSLGGTSRMMREYHVRICERLGVKLSGPTRHGVVFVH